MLADVSYCLDLSKLVPVKTNLCREVMTLACVGSSEVVRIGQTRGWRGYDSDVGQESLILWKIEVGDITAVSDAGN